MSRVVTGPHPVLAALHARPQDVLELFITSDVQQRQPEVLRVAAKHGVSITESSRRELDAIVPEGVAHKGVAARLQPYPYVDLSDLTSSVRDDRVTLVAFDEVTDPHNFGAILRTGVAFGVSGFIVHKDRCASVTEAVSRTSAGAVEHARIARVTNLAKALATLKEQGLRVAGLAEEGTATLDAPCTGSEGLVLVVGSEGRGLRRLTRERCDVLVRLPTVGTFTTLNASVAASIAIFERQARHNSMEESAGASPERG